VWKVQRKGAGRTLRLEEQAAHVLYPKGVVVALGTPPGRTHIAARAWLAWQM